MQRAAIGADHPLGQAQGGNQFGDPGGRAGVDGEPAGCGQDARRPGVVARMQRVVLRAGRPEEEKL